MTEDAHTALKMQRLGWKSAFLDIPLAAGLATERLVLHVIQRTRWARGMTQIFRLDNPLLGRGLTIQQRLCYLSAMLYYQFALPRIAFLTAPLLRFQGRTPASGDRHFAGYRRHRRYRSCLCS